MAGLYILQVNQRVRIRRTGGGSFRAPSESAKGSMGAIAPQQTDDWAGTLLEMEPDAMVTYYVTIDGGSTELIAADWLEPARPGDE